MKQPPLVSVGQGSYRRDYSGDEFNGVCIWLLAIGLTLGACAALLYDSTGGARIDEPRTTPTASSSAHGS